MIRLTEEDMKRTVSTWTRVASSLEPISFALFSGMQVNMIIITYLCIKDVERYVNIILKTLSIYIIQNIPEKNFWIKSANYSKSYFFWIRQYPYKSQLFCVIIIILGDRILIIIPSHHNYTRG